MWNTYDDDDDDIFRRVREETAQLPGFAIDDHELELGGALDDDEGTFEPEEGDGQDEEGWGLPR